MHDALNRGDLETFLAHVHPEVRFRSLVAEMENHDFRGHDGVRQGYRDVAEALGGLQFGIERIETSDETALGCLGVEGSVAGVGVPQRMWQAVRSGKGKQCGGRPAAPSGRPAKHSNPKETRTPMATPTSNLSENTEARERIVEMLKKAYWMEIETVMSYIANSVNPDGVRAQEIIESLRQDVQEELGHAQRFAERIKELYGVVPGSLEFTPEQSYLQPPEQQTDIVHVIRGVIEAEAGAIEHYNRIIEACDGVDWVTQDMVIDILGDEQAHKRLFEGFLREYEAEGLA